MLMDFEFWFERYQTLAAGGIAVAAAVWTARPAFKQLAILEDQARTDKRDRLLAKFQMTQDIAALLDANKWYSAEEGVAPWAGPDDKVTEQQLERDYKARKDRAIALIIAVRASGAPLTEPLIGLPVELQEIQFDIQTVYSQIDSQIVAWKTKPDHKLSELDWLVRFNFDGMMMGVLSQSQEKLRSLQNRLASDLARA